MDKISLFVMYLLWTIAIIFILLTTFTNFQHIDLNLIAGALLFFAALNSYLVTSRPNPKEPHEQ